MTNKQRLPLLSSLYINYIFQGIGLIIIAQNIPILQQRWEATLSQVTLVISALGVGRILSLNYAGYFSDKYGRKASVQVGIVSYIIFFLGIILAPNYKIACIATLFEGAGNSFLDTGTYPAVIESYPPGYSSSYLSVLIKAFISTGQFILPFITLFLLNNNYYYGYSFIGCAALIFVNMLFIAKIKFPKANVVSSSDKENESTVKEKMNINGVMMLIFSFISISLFMIYITWAPTYAQTVVNMSKIKSLSLVSIYSICSFISVLVTTLLAKKGINSAILSAIYTFATAIFMLLAIVLPSETTMYLVSFGVGFFAAGGIWQLGVSLIMEFFPKQKGKYTGLYSLLAAISLMITPYLTGLMAEKSIKIVFLYNMILGIIATVVLIYVSIKYKEVKRKNKIK